VKIIQKDCLVRSIQKELFDIEESSKTSDLPVIKNKGYMHLIYNADITENHEPVAGCPLISPSLNLSVSFTFFP
jgi:hypothetical protein